MQATNEGEFVVSFRYPWQKLCEANAWDPGGDRVKRTAKLGGCGRFGIKMVRMGRPSPKPDMNHRLSPGTRQRACPVRPGSQADLTCPRWKPGFPWSQGCKLGSAIKPTLAEDKSRTLPNQKSLGRVFQGRPVSPQKRRKNQLFARWKCQRIRSYRRCLSPALPLHRQ